ncbi:MAG: hypothetical protein LBU46_02785, partial [Candidatus Accumulibacter sp.]|nr:hypothetical protein [Accumulibacter sp.]
VINSYWNADANPGLEGFGAAPTDKPDNTLTGLTGIDRNDAEIISAIVSGGNPATVITAQADAAAAEAAAAAESARQAEAAHLEQEAVARAEMTNSQARESSVQLVQDTLAEPFTALDSARTPFDRLMARITEGVSSVEASPTQYDEAVEEVTVE